MGVLDWVSLALDGNTLKAPPNMEMSLEFV